MLREKIHPVKFAGQLFNGVKSKHLISLALVALVLSISAIYLLGQKGTIEEKEIEEIEEEINCPSCLADRQIIPIPKIEATGLQTFEDDVRFSAVATALGSDTKYFNWIPKNPCPSNQGCYLSKITARVTFLNTGDPLVFSKEGAGYIRIANGKESNCKDPSQATFTRYIAYSPAMKGGDSWTKRTCAESATPNTCDLSKTDGFDDKSDCFSLKLFAPSENEGEINFATHLISLTYTWKIAD